MPYIGNQHNVGDHVNNFKVLDDISSHTATFDGSSSPKFIRVNKMDENLNNAWDSSGVSLSAVFDMRNALLFETSDGYKFKSIDSLFAQKKKKSFIFTRSPDAKGDVPAGYDGKILEYNSDNRVNVQEKFEMGTYGTKLIVFDPFNCFYQVIKKTSEESKKGTKLAGKDLPTLNEKFDVKSKDNTTRATYYLVDKGTLPTGDVEQQIEKSGEPNFAAEQALNQGIRRYNQLFSGMITATISGDFSLHAGDVIFVDSPGLTTDQDEELNREFGGLYIIASLCHYVSSEETYTKMNLVRDSFGRKGNHTSR